MTREQKNLLLRDLCSRLPYGVKVKFGDSKPAPLTVIEHNEFGWQIGSEDEFGGMVTTIDNVKPYLFPLSSMTKEQRKEYEDALTYHDYVKGGWTIAKSFDDEYIIPYWFVDFCNKNHFDYRGLIPKGLANDATGKNIY